MKLNIACEDVMSLDPNTYVRTWVCMTMRMHMHLCLHKHMHVDAQVHTSMDMHNAHTFALRHRLLCAPPPRPSPVLLILGEHREPRREQPLVCLASPQRCPRPPRLPTTRYTARRRRRRRISLQHVHKICMCGFVFVCVCTCTLSAYVACA